MESSTVLCYVFMGKYLPSPIFHRLLAACVAHWPIATKMNNGTLDNLIFCGCCVFQLDNVHKLTIHFRDYIMYMRVTRMGIKDRTPSSKWCMEARQFVSDTLIKIIGYLGPSLKFEYSIQCPEYNGDSVNSLIPVSLLKQNAEVCCACHDNIIESNKLLKFWFDDKGSRGENGRDTGEQEKVYATLSVFQGSQGGKGGVTENKEIQDQILPQVQDVRPKKMNIASKPCQSKGVPCSDPKLLCQILNKSQQAFSSRSILEINCQSVGLELYNETPADGNCFFEAVSSQLHRLNCGVQKSPQQLRQEVVTFMRTNRVLLVPEGTINLDNFIYGETFEDYCTRMARDGEWADHVVVVAMARKLQMDIMIVMSSPAAGPEDIIVWVVGQTDFHGKPILLGHIWESHYLSLQPIGVNKNKAGLMKAEIDQTEAVYVHKLLVQQAMSVGIIRSPSICGTGFRVGPCYIMTAKHVIDRIMNAAVPLGQQMNLPHPLSNRDVFIDFSYEMDLQTSNENLSFHFEPRILYGNDELDTVILQLKHDNTKKYPPPLTKFTQPPKNESDGYFIGHSKGEIKKTDKYKCVTLNPHEIAAAKEWSMKRVNVDGFVGIDDLRRVLLHCSFEKGASGSPGFWIDPSNGQACVLLMLLRGYPDWYYDENYKDKTIGMLPKDLIEQGVYMTSIYDDLNKRNTVLCQEIFNFHCDDVEMV